MKKLPQNFWYTMACEIAGSLLISAGIYNFAVQSSFPLTGFSGIALIIHRLTTFQIGITTIVLNIPVAIMCYKLLGRRFFLRSVRCMIISSLMIDYLMPLFPVYEGSRMLSAICTGALQGVGYGIIYKAGSSTGGLDFITLAIKTKKPYLALGAINFTCDFVIVVIGGLIFNDVDGIIYGVIINYLVAFFIDKIMFGANAGKLLLIITEKGKDVTRLIDETIARGCTLIQGQGGYRFADKQVVMCACSVKQVYTLQEALKEQDPAAFTIILDSSEVHGEGFKYTTVGHN